MLTVGSLFSGIGGFDLGFERAGMSTLWFAEQDAFCQRVLAKHWAGVPCHPDVRALVADSSGERWREGSGVIGGVWSARRGEGQGALPVPVPYVDVLCGGFPCQDISLAGRGGGIAEGQRSGLWREFARLIGELRPRYVVVENVPAITSRGLDIVLGDLAACGFDAEWDHLPASAFGAPHRRDRFWLVAYPDESGRGSWLANLPAGQPDAPGTRAAPDADGPRSQGLRASAGQPQEPEPRDGRSLADAPRDAAAGSEPQTGAERQRARAGGQRSGAASVADPEGQPVGTGLRSGEQGGQRGRRPGDGGGSGDAADPALGGSGTRRPQRAGEAGAAGGVGGSGGNGQPESRMGRGFDGLSPWLDGAWEQGLPRVAAGVPQRVDRLRSLGNALVPQIAEWIGERIVSYEATR